jgi:hypothetical protein
VPADSAGAQQVPRDVPDVGRAGVEVLQQGGGVAGQQVVGVAGQQHGDAPVGQGGHVGHEAS